MAATLSITFTISLLVLILLTENGVEAIRCYSCTSPNSKNCEDPFNADGIALPSCGTGINTCLKSKLSVSGTMTYSRSCGNPELSGNSCASVSMSGASGTVCYCSTDNCNPAPTIHTVWKTGLMLIVPVITAIVFLQ